MMDFPLTLAAIFRHAEQVFPRRPVVTRRADGSLHRYTYADFGDRARRLASALQRLGVRPGDRVATLGWNHYQHLEAYFAHPAHRRGAAHAQPPPASRRTHLHRQRRGRSRRARRRALVAALGKVRAEDPCRSHDCGRRRRGPVPAGSLDYEALLAERRTVERAAGPRRAHGGGDVLHHRHHRPTQGRALFASRARAACLRGRAAERDGRQRAGRRAAGRADVSRQRLGPAVRGRHGRRQAGDAGAASRSAPASSICSCASA